MKGLCPKGIELEQPFTMILPEPLIIQRCCINSKQKPRKNKITSGFIRFMGPFQLKRSINQLLRDAASATVANYAKKKVHPERQTFERGDSTQDSNE
jgi:hypothetical protein